MHSPTEEDLNPGVQILPRSPLNVFLKAGSKLPSQIPNLGEGLMDLPYRGSCNSKIDIMVYEL